MANAKKATTPKKREPELTIPAKPDEDERVALARASLRPTVQGAVTLREYNKGNFGDLPLNGLVASLSDQCKAVIDGDLERPESLLTVQAQTLDAIFNTLSQRAIRAEYMDHLDRYLRLALKAQAQCARTLEVLAAIKNPAPVAFVRQANIGQAVQVNNGAAPAPSQPLRAEKTENQQNELLEVKSHERLDTEATQAASRANPTMETVGAVNGATNGGG